MGNVCSSAAATTNVVAPPTKRTTNPQMDNKSAAEKSFSVPTTSSAMTSSLLSAQSRPFAAVYETRDELGKGQYATVFKCVSKPNALPNGEKFVGAVKVIDKSKLTPEDLVALNIEVKAMDTLKDHPNFVKCHDFFSEPHFFYLTMELLTGGELFDRICEKERYSEREARQVMWLMTNAIAYAHSKGVVHRDLKPENILLKSKEDDTSIKVADLGFAGILSSPNQVMSTPCGTPGYVAPEVLSNKPYGSQCDAWSLGVIFYILLCGYPPFSDDNTERLFSMIQSGRYEMDPQEWSVISESAKDLVRKILVVDPAKRLTCDQILHHPWMKMDLNSIPDHSLVEALKQLKKFQARRRLKKVLQLVRSVVRTRMLLGIRKAKVAMAEGKSEAEVQAVFFQAAQQAKFPPQANATTNPLANVVASGALRSPARIM